MTPADRSRLFYKWVEGLLSSGDANFTRAAATGIRLAMYGRHGHDAYPSMPRVAGNVGLSERRVREHIKLLCANGWLHKDARPGTSDAYCIRFPDDPGDACPLGRKHGSDDQEIPISLLLNGPSNDGRVAGREPMHSYDWGADVGRKFRNEPLSPKETSAVLAAVAEAQQTLGIAESQIEQGLLELAAKRRAGLLTSPVVTSVMALAFIKSVRVKPAKLAKGGGRDLEKERQAALEWEDRNSTYDAWTRRLSAATRSELAEVLTQWEQSKEATLERERGWQEQLRRQAQ